MESIASPCSAAMTSISSSAPIVRSLRIGVSSSPILGEEPGVVVTDDAVYFTDKNGGSEVTLSQSGFANAVSARGHEEGWASAPGKPGQAIP